MRYKKEGKRREDLLMILLSFSHCLLMALEEFTAAAIMSVTSLVLSRVGCGCIIPPPAPASSPPLLISHSIHPILYPGPGQNLCVIWH
jgi:hypothetical protein